MAADPPPVVERWLVLICKEIVAVHSDNNPDHGNVVHKPNRRYSGQITYPKRNKHSRHRDVTRKQKIVAKAKRSLEAFRPEKAPGRGDRNGRAAHTASCDAAHSHDPPVLPGKKALPLPFAPSIIRIAL